ncbi:MAG: WD40 repeat domain-containing protein [Opitutaceae bacterium]|jgi:WD40 repeat protein|nr:WD40 repeat domain-containing protein [Opitutaceae bacterium]
MQLTKTWAAPIDDYVIDLAWSPDAAVLAVASQAGPLHLFAGSTGENRHQLPGHEDGANCLAFAPSAPALLASGGQDGAVKLWDAATAQHVATVSLGSAWVEHLAWRPQVSGLSSQVSAPILAAASGRDLVFLKPDAAVAHRFKPAPKTLSALAWHPQGGALAAAYFGGVCLWDADDHHAQREYPYAQGIATLAWSPPDGRWLVSGNADPSVHLWLPEEDQEFHMSGYETKVRQISFDFTGTRLATTGGQDVCVWDCSGAGPEGREPTMLPHDAPLCAVAFQNRHGLLAAASRDGVLQLWSPERASPLRATVKMPAPATRLAWSPDDRFLAVGSERGVVYVLRVEN